MGLLLDLMEGARNCVRGYACVKPGEKVLLWTDRSGQAHPDVVRAFGVAVEEIGAEAVFLSSKSGEFRRKRPLQKSVLSAIRESDVVLSFQKLENAATLHSSEVAEIIFYTPTRNAAILTLTPELLNSEWARFPADLLFALSRKIREQAQSSGSDVFRITDAHGSDFTGRISYRYGFKYVDPPKQWQFFPGGDMAELPDSPVNGTLVFEQLEGFAGLLSEPIRLTVEEQWITRVEGGEEARWFGEQMKRYENGNFFCEVAVGVHPKAPVSIGLKTRAMDTITHRHSGTFHCGVGKWANPDVKVKSGWHWDGGGLRPTFTVGDVELIRAGRLTALDDPEIRELASRYGHPDDVLAEVW